MAIPTTRLQAIKDAFKKAFSRYRLTWRTLNSDQAYHTIANELKEVFPPVTFGTGPVVGFDAVSQKGDLYIDRSTGTMYVYKTTGWAAVGTGGTTTTTIDIQDEGVLQGPVDTINFTGSAVTATVAGSTATVNITGTGGGSSGSWLTGTASWDPVSLAPGEYVTTTVTVAGAALGDAAEASFSNAVPGGVLLLASVTAADTVTVTLLNISGTTQDLGSGTLTARVFSVWFFSGSTTLAPSLNPGEYQTTPVTVTGAVVGDSALASLGVALPDGWVIYASVTASNTATVVIANFSGTAQTLASSTLTVRTIH